MNASKQDIALRATAAEYWQRGQAKGRRDERKAIRQIIREDLIRYESCADNGGFGRLATIQCAERARALQDILGELSKRAKRVRK